MLFLDLEMSLITEDLLTLVGLNQIWLDLDQFTCSKVQEDDGVCCGIMGIQLDISVYAHLIQ